MTDIRLGRSVRDGSTFTYLTRELTRLVLALDENPNQEIPGRPPIDDWDLVKTFRVFMVHVKSNQLDVPTLRQRAAAAGSSFRAELFLRLFATVFGG